MSSVSYRIESHYPIVGPLLPYLSSARSIVISVRELAIALAKKSSTHPEGHEIRVIYVPTGAVIFRNTQALLESFNNDFRSLY